MLGVGGVSSTTLPTFSFTSVGIRELERTVTPQEQSSRWAELIEAREGSNLSTAAVKGEHNEATNRTEPSSTLFSLRGGGKESRREKLESVEVGRVVIVNVGSEFRLTIMQDRPSCLFMTFNFRYTIQGYCR